MRILIATLTTLMLFAAKPANSVELKPLVEVLTKEDSPAMAVYGFTRCAGLYLTLAAVFHEVAPDKAKVLEEASSKAMLAAYKINKNVDDVGLTKNTTPEMISEQAGRIANLYKTRWISNRDATGHGSDAFFESEGEVCKALMAIIDK
jgi:hypothetical protein